MSILTLLDWKGILEIQKFVLKMYRIFFSALALVLKFKLFYQKQLTMS